MLQQQPKSVTVSDRLSVYIEKIEEGLLELHRIFSKRVFLISQKTPDSLFEEEKPIYSLYSDAIGSISFHMMMVSVLLKSKGFDVDIDQKWLENLWLTRKLGETFEEALNAIQKLRDYFTEIANKFEDYLRMRGEI